MPPNLALNVMFMYVCVRAMIMIVVVVIYLLEYAITIPFLFSVLNYDNWPIN